MPTLKYWNSYLKAYPELSETGRVKGMDWDGKSKPEEYFREALEMREGRNLDGLVPATNFWIIANEQYVGRMSIRHTLNEWLQSYGGHIGYEVKKSARRQGIATKALGLALDYCRNDLELLSTIHAKKSINIMSVFFTKLAFSIVCQILYIGELN